MKACLPVLNAMQRSCESIALGSDSCFVVSSPTGSGKTIVLAMAMLRKWLFLSINAVNELIASGAVFGTPSRNAVYVAPTKALCRQLVLNWNAAFR